MGDRGTRIRLRDDSPGRRAAERGSVASRPGQPGYLDDQLRGIVADLARSPGLRSVLGDHIDVAVRFDKRSEAFYFVVKRWKGNGQ